MFTDNFFAAYRSYVLVRSFAEDSAMESFQSGPAVDDNEEANPESHSNIEVTPHNELARRQTHNDSTVDHMDCGVVNE